MASSVGQSLVRLLDRTKHAFTKRTNSHLGEFGQRAVGCVGAVVHVSFVAFMRKLF